MFNNQLVDTVDDVLSTDDIGKVLIGDEEKNNMSLTDDDITEAAATI